MEVYGVNLTNVGTIIDSQVTFLQLARSKVGWYVIMDDVNKKIEGPNISSFKL